MTVEEWYKQTCLHLLYHQALYYCVGITVISDSEYDAKNKALELFEQSRPDLKHPESPTSRVGSDQLSTYPKGVQCAIRNNYDL